MRRALFLAVVALAVGAFPARAHPRDPQTHRFEGADVLMGAVWVAGGSVFAGIAFVVQEKGVVAGSEDIGTGPWFEAWSRLLPGGPIPVVRGPLGKTDVNLTAGRGGTVRLRLGSLGTATLTITSIPGSGGEMGGAGIAVGTGPDEHEWSMRSSFLDYTRARATGRLGSYSLTSRPPGGGPEFLFLARAASTCTEKDGGSGIPCGPF